MREKKSAAARLEWRRKKVADLKGLERRTFSTEDMELREADDGTLRLTGYACVTDVPYDVGWYVETIQAGAFTRTLSESPDVQLLINHTGMPLARTRSGTLTLEERTTSDADGKKGLWVDASLDPEDPDVQSLQRKMDRRDIDQMSFAFMQTGQKWNEDFSQRLITACSIHRGDVSVVNFGANPATLASIRSADAAAALAELGVEVVLASFVEWRDYTLLPREQRAGKTLSAATTDVLTQVLNLVVTAEESTDEAQALLEDLMGVGDDDNTDEDGESVERSIDTEKGLCAAIRAVVREPGHDERRAEIIKRAVELDRGGLVPDAWRENGSLDESRALATPELRETYNDTYAALQGALDEKLEGEYWYCWVQDFTDTEVIYYAGGDLWSAPYTLVPSGPVTIGDAVKVRPVTEYVPAGDDGERAAPPAETRAPAPLPDYTTRAAQEYDLLKRRGGRR